MLTALKISMLHWFAGAIAHGNGGAVPRWHSGVIVLRYAGTEAQRNSPRIPGGD
jgi:hypothetical protein